MIDVADSVEKAVNSFDVVRCVIRIGPPGIGKTETAKQIAQMWAKRHGLEFVDFAEVGDVDKLSEDQLIFVELSGTAMMVEDVGGFPHLNADKPFVPVRLPEHLYVLVKYPCVIHIDEFNTAMKPVIAQMLKLVEGRVHTRAMHPLTRVLLSGNDFEDNSLVNVVPKPIWNKCAVMRLKTSIESWLAYMARIPHHPGVTAYVMQSKTLLNLNDDGPSTTPRSLTHLAIHLRKHPEDSDYAPYLYLHPKDAANCVNFLRYNVNLDAISPRDIASMSLNEVYVTASLLAQALMQNPNRRYFELLGAIADAHIDIATMIVKAMSKDPKAMTNLRVFGTKAYRNVMQRLNQIAQKFVEGGGA